MEEIRTKYRALKLNIDGADFITDVEENMVDPAASKRNCQEKLRTDKIYLDLLSRYRELAIKLSELVKKLKKDAKNSVQFRKLKPKMEELKIKIKDREKEIRKDTILYSLVPHQYQPIEDDEVSEVVSLLKKRKNNELVSVDKVIIEKQK